MDDLNAPLGMHKKPKAPARKAASSSSSSKGFVAAGILLGTIAAINAAVLFTTPDPDTFIVRLPEPEPEIEVAEAPTPTQTAEPDEPEVQVIYGTEENLPEAPDEPNIPVPLPRETQTDVSEGGARIITIRDPSKAEIGQPEAEAHLPYEPAIEETQFGPLPKRADDGRKPMDIYARPWSSARGKRIALVIGGLGLSQTGTQRAIKMLPPEITLAFAPTGFSLNRWMQDARRKGHELLVQVPMEPFNYPEVNPGPNTLRLASSSETNVENLQWAMGTITNYTGIVNYLGARFMADEAAMQPILKELSERGLLFFNDGSNGATASLAENAKAAGVPYVSGNTVIDVGNTQASIRAKLKALETIAEARGYAVGYGSALELTVETVAQWANQAKKDGFELVGIAAIANELEND